jgi:hypothetical protein
MSTVAVVEDLAVLRVVDVVDNKLLCFCKNINKSESAILILV